MVRIKNVLCGIISIAVMASMMPRGVVFADYIKADEYEKVFLDEPCGSSGTDDDVMHECEFR